MTDMSVGAATTAQIATTYAASQAAGAAPTTEAPVPVSSGDKTATTGQSSTPQDTIELSDEALAAAYDHAYMETTLGRLYSADTIAGLGAIFGRIKTGEIKVAVDPETGGRFEYETSVRYPGLPLGDTAELGRTQAALWDDHPFGIIPNEMRQMGDLIQQRAKDFSDKLDAILASGQWASSETQEKIEALKKQYHIMQPQTERDLALNDIYTAENVDAAFSKAIDLAFKEQGVDKNDVANIDIGHAIYNGSVMVSFKDGSSPLELDDYYVSEFAIRTLQQNSQASWDATTARFRQGYNAILENFGVDPLAVSAWTVKADNTFHLFVDDGQGGRYQEYVIDDPDFVAAALAEASDNDDQKRLGLSLAVAQGEKWVDTRRGFELEPDPDPETTTEYGATPSASPSPATNPPPEIAAGSTADSSANEIGASDSASSADAAVNDEAISTQETEEEKEKARARRKLLLSMGIRAESDPNANKPDWLSSGEIARLNARYADAMSARDRMLQRFSRKGELEGAFNEPDSPMQREA